MATLILELKGEKAERAAKAVRRELDKVGKEAKQTERQMGGLGGKMAGVGSDMKKMVAGFVAFGVALVAVRKGLQGIKESVNVFAEFEGSLTKINTLVGISLETLDEWTPTILDIAAETGKSATEMSEALFFITSAGLRGQEALDALQASAYGSAIGLGEAATIADAATSVMNAYGAEVYSATEATNILALAIREGKLEASALAPVMGRLVPTAVSLGVSFEDLAGVMAVMSRTGLDASEASTSLNAILSIMAKGGTKQAAEILDSVNLSMGDLRDVAASPGGLIEAMRLLNEATSSLSEEALAQVIPNIRAFRGVMNVLGQDAATVDAVMRGVAAGTDVLGEGMAIWSQTAEASFAKFDTAAERLKLALGEELAPVIAEVADAMTSLAGNQAVLDFFTNLGLVIGGVVQGLAELTGALALLRQQQGLQAELGMAEEIGTSQRFLLEMLTTHQAITNEQRIQLELEIEKTAVLLHNADVAATSARERLRELQEAASLDLGFVELDLTKLGFGGTELQENVAETEEEFKILYDTWSRLTELSGRVGASIEEVADGTAGAGDAAVGAVAPTEEYIKALATLEKQFVLMGDSTVILEGTLQDQNVALQNQIIALQGGASGMRQWRIEAAQNAQMAKALAAGILEAFAPAELFEFIAATHEAAVEMVNLQDKVSGLQVIADDAAKSAQQLAGAFTFQPFFLEFPAPPEVESGKAKEMGEAFGDIWADAVAHALGDALTALFSGEEIDWEQIGSSVGTAIGTAAGSTYGPMGAAAGGAIGGVLGGAIGGIFMDDEAEKLKEAQEAFERLVDFVQGSLSSIEQSVIGTLENIMEALADMTAATERTGDEYLAIGREVTNAANEIFGIVPDDFGERIRAAVHLMERLGDIFSDELIEQFGAIDLSALTDSILAEFEGATAHLEQAGLEQTFDNLIAALRAAGLSADETAAAIKRATASYKDQQQAIINDAISPLLQMMMQFGVFENESRAKQAEILRFQAQLDLRLIEAQLTALGVMDATIRKWVDALGEAIAGFNFAANLGSPGTFDVQLPRGGRGGRRGSRKEKRKQKKRDREDVRDFLAGFELSDFENELRDINKQFDDYLEKAHGNVDLERRLAEARAEAIQEAFDALHQPLRDLRDSLRDIGATPGESFSGMQDEFFDLFARVRSGDTDAIRELAEAGGDYRDAILDMFGGTRQGRDLIATMDEMLSQILGDAAVSDDPILTETKRQTDVLSEIRDLLASENTLHVVDKGGNIRLLRLTTEDANRYAQAQRDRLIDSIERTNATTHAHLVELIERTQQQNATLTRAIAPVVTRPSARQFEEEDVGGLT